ncbi:MAG: hypothetical protein B7Z63_01050 [Ignavibacteriae bacterium 37-53-5]|nr:MAG: hypothetical protein B7Z63_01050 [Ignavibacteriae bacterium 37-53-5]
MRAARYISHAARNVPAAPGVLLAIAVLCTVAVAQETRYPIEEDGKFGFIDSTGRVVVPPVYKTPLQFSEGYAQVTLVSFFWWYYRHVGYLGVSGDTAIDTRYQEGGKFSDGLARVRTSILFGGGEWGFIDTAGREVIKPSFYGAGDFHDGRARVENSSGFLWLGQVRKYGFIDRTGRLLTGFIYERRRRRFFRGHGQRHCRW